jgi:hypothetical protein
MITTVHKEFKEFNQSAEKLKEHIHKETRKRNMRLNIDINISSEDIRNKIKSSE